jgi:hypothetical protein
MNIMTMNIFHEYELRVLVQFVMNQILCLTMIAELLVHSSTDGRHSVSCDIACLTCLLAAGVTDFSLHQWHGFYHACT